MKAPIKIEQRNAGDYLASIATVCPESEAEYFIILKNGDKLENDPTLGLTLTRGRTRYTQVTKMSTFRGVAFVEDTPYAHEAETITAKLLPA